MFKHYYNMSYNPFSKDIKNKDIFKSDDINQVHGRLNHLLKSGGIGLVTAEPGFGKTFAVKTWADSQNPNTTKIIYLCMTTITNREFFQSLCRGFGIEPVFRKADMFEEIQNTIKMNVLERRVRVIIIIDEAHYLRPSVLKDLQMITNFEMDSRELVSIMLVGHSVLTTIINRQPYESLRQRLLVNYRLKGLSSDCCKEYAKSRLKSVGADTELIDEAAIENACISSNGSLRRFNFIMTNSLTIGAQQEARHIDTEIVQSATSELDL